MLAESIFIIGATLAGLATIFFRNYKRGQVLRSLRKEERIALADFNHKQVGKIVGQVAFHTHKLESPISKRPCVYYHIIVEERKGDNWRPLINDERYVDFLVQTEGRTALVEKRFLAANVFKDIKFNSNNVRKVSRSAEMYLKKRGVSLKNFWGLSRRFRIQEGILHEGEFVAVRGRGHWEMLPDPEEQRLIFKGEADMEVLVTDKRAAF